MKVLVTGAGGRLGFALCDRLRGEGMPVVGLDRGSLDITRREDVLRLLGAESAEVVVQCAAFTDVDGAEIRSREAFAVNVEGARNVAEGCAHAGSRLIHMSTDFLFGGELRRPCREDDPTAPEGVYARSKGEGEETVREVCPEALIVRTAWLYGGRGDDFVSKVLARARQGQSLQVVRDQVGSPTLVSDLAEALVRLTRMEPAPTGLLHVANEGGCSRLELAEAALKVAGVEAAVEGIATSALGPGSAPRPAFSVLDCRLYHRLSGQPMRPWKRALEAFLKARKPPI